jgi:predicted sulfurtransferase
MFVKSCDEIIALGRSPSEISWRNSAEHLEPAEFHKMLLQHAAQQSRDALTADISGAGCSDSDATQGRGDPRHAQPLVSDDSVQGGSPARSKAADAGLETGSGIETDNSSLVLLDCRNLYESEIGRFDGAIRCPTRHFTEFPAVADRMVDDMQLRDKTVLMYCTGGIRCERASAYLRSVGVRRCFQLKGGIAKYCEAFPAAEPAPAAGATASLVPSDSGNPGRASHAQPAAIEQSESEDSRTPASSSQTAPGTTTPMRNISMFRGKNFVFDRRMALQAGRPGDVVGECALCGAAWDQYDREVACEQCSALVLVCVDCRPNVFVRGGPNQPTVRRKRKQANRSSSDSKCARSDGSTSGTDQILCTYCCSGSPASR